VTAVDASRHLTERSLLSSMRSLLVLGTLMTEGADEQQILQLATTAAPTLAPCDVVRVELVGASPTPPRLAAQLRAAGMTGGAVTLAGSGWAWAFPLNGTSGHLGHLVVGARREPSGEEQFLLRALAQQVGGALANRRPARPGAGHGGHARGAQRAAAGQRRRAAAQHGHPRPAHRRGRLR
jgi:GAF domain-containing protein